MLVHYEATAIGPSHKLQGRDNQDHFAVRDLKVTHQSDPAHPQETRAIVAAVADGVSQMVLGGEGAHAAAEAAVDTASRAFELGLLAPGDASALKGVFERALAAVAHAAIDIGPMADIVSLATTLCLVVWDGEHAWVGQAGDSGAIGIDDDGAPFQLTHAHRGAQPNQVFPLHDPTHWEFSYHEDVAGVLLASDGMLAKFVDPDALCGEATPDDFNADAIELFMRSDDDVVDAEGLSNGAARYLESLPARVVDDDKTVVVLLKTEEHLLPDQLEPPCGSPNVGVTDLEEGPDPASAAQPESSEISGESVVLPWADELRLRAPDIANTAGGTYITMLEYHLMCGVGLQRAVEFSAEAAAASVLDLCLFDEPAGADDVPDERGADHGAL